MKDTGYLRLDEDGHWYFIPDKVVKMFDKSEVKLSKLEMYSNEWNTAVNNHIDKFSKYMLDGGPFGNRYKIIPHTEKYDEN